MPSRTENIMAAKDYIIQGNKLYKEGKVPQAIEKYLSALKLNPNSAPSLNKLAGIYERQKKFNKAINYLQQLIKLQPEVARTQARLARAMMKQRNFKEAIYTYKKALTLQSNLPLWVYSELGDCLSQEGQIDEAIATYQKAIELDPDNPNFYLKLTQLYAQKTIKLKPDLSENVANVLNYQLQEKKVASSFKYSNEGETYSKIWTALNQTSLDSLEKESAHFPQEFNLNQVRRYLKLASQYKIINLEALTEEDRLFLESNNISLANLDLIVNDDATKQEVYLKHFSQDQKLKSWQSSAKKIPKSVFQRDYRIDFQLSMIKTGYIYTVCPINGSILRSNQSFIVPGPQGTFLGAYYFKGAETFYLLATNFLYNLEAVYFPHLELIILLTKTANQNAKAQFEKIIVRVNNLKSFMISSWRAVLSYLKYDGKKEVVVAGVAQKINLAHNLVNDLSGIQKLSKAGILNQVDKFICGTQEYFGQLEDIFPEISSDKIIRMNFSDVQKFVLNNNCFALGVGDKFCSENLSQRIYQVSIKKCTPYFLEQVEQAKKCFPLVFISFRLYKRSWVSQVEGIANIIDKLSAALPDLGVVFDGFSIADSHVDMEGGYASFVKEQIEKEKDVVKQILALLSNKSTRIYDTVGCRMYESIVWAHTVDFYIATMGASLVKVCTLANKPGIGHCCTDYIKPGEPWWNAARENGVNPIVVPAHHIIDLEKKKRRSSNYDLDWKVIYDEAMKLIPQLNRNSKE